MKKLLSQLKVSAVIISPFYSCSLFYCAIYIVNQPLQEWSGCLSSSAVRQVVLKNQALLRLPLALSSAILRISHLFLSIAALVTRAESLIVMIVPCCKARVWRGDGFPGAGGGVWKFFVFFFCEIYFRWKKFLCSMLVGGKYGWKAQKTMWRP